MENMMAVATANLPYIKQQLRRFRGAGLYDAEDLIGEVVLLSARHAAKYDPDRGTPKQFLYWMVRTAIRNASRIHKRSDYRCLPTDTFDHMESGNAYRSLEDKLCVESIRKTADAIQAACMDTVLNEDEADEVAAKTGLSMSKRNYQIYKLRGGL